MKKHTNLDDQIYRKKSDNCINNLIVGIAIGVLILVCAGIYVFTSFVEAVSY